jgi:S1-C subfamily serine protease
MVRIVTRLPANLSALSILAIACIPAAAQERAKEKALYVRLLYSSTWVVVLKPAQPAKPGTVSWNEGSGWVVSAKRKLVVTNYHVVGDSKEVQVFFPYYVNDRALTARKPYVALIAQGGGSPGTVIAADKARDLAVIQLKSAPSWIKALPVAPQGVTAGERVYNLGNPGGDTSLWQFSASTVLDVRKRELKSKTVKGEIRVRAVIIETDDKKTRKGQSGSLLVNPRGELVGVVQSVSQTEPQTTMSIERSDVLEFLNGHGVKPLMAERRKQ